jgi:hypothetical protein
MLIHWLIPGNYQAAEDLSKSNLASIRMRAGLVGNFANDIQIKVSAGDHIDSNADVIVVGKIGGDCQNGRANFWIEQLFSAKKQSKKIVLDYTDHHLGTMFSAMGIFYKNVLPLIDTSVVSSTRISQLLAQFFIKKITVIEDPIEIQITPPKSTSPTFETTLLWFGHSTNTSYLIKYLLNNLLCDTDFRLIVLSNSSGLETLALHQKSLRSNIRLVPAEWSLQNMIDASKLSHGCLIPSDLHDSRKSGASSNRLITSFALGLPVSADVLESYAPFSDYFHDIRETPLSVFIENLTFYAKKIDLAQNTIVPNFNQRVIAEKWKNFFLSVIQN